MKLLEPSAFGGEWPDVLLVTDGDLPHKARLYVKGVEISSIVRRIDIDAQVGHVVTVTLELVTGSVEMRAR